MWRAQYGLWCLLAFVTLANAATWTVTSNADSGAGTLRNTVAGAAAGDFIFFAAPMTITLTSGTIYIQQGIYINGDINNNGLPDDVTISGNSQYEIFYISNPSQTTTLYGLTLTRGYGVQAGAVYSIGVDVAISNCNITFCSAIDNGGAVYVTAGSSTTTRAMSIVYTTFYNNTAGNTGGAVAVSGAYTRITACLFRNNTAFRGGALSHFNYGQSTVSDSTFSANKAKPQSPGDFTFGGAIWNYGTSLVSVVRCTFSGNNAGVGSATYTNAQASLTTSSSIFSDGGDELSGPGTITSYGFNLMQQSVFPQAQASDLVGYSASDIGLGPLADNGGLSWTHAVLAGSWAIDNGDGSYSCIPCTDQRGSGYPRKQGSAIDIGAYESPFSGSVG